MGLFDFWRRWTEEWRAREALEAELDGRVRLLPTSHARELVERLLSDREYVTTRAAGPKEPHRDALPALSATNRELLDRFALIKTQDELLILDQVKYSSELELRGLVVLGLAWMQCLIVCEPHHDAIWGVSGEHRPDEMERTVQPSLYHFILSTLSGGAAGRLQALLDAHPAA